MAISIHDCLPLQIRTMFMTNCSDYMQGTGVRMHSSYITV